MRVYAHTHYARKGLEILTEIKTFVFTLTTYANTYEQCLGLDIEPEYARGAVTLKQQNYRHA